MKYNIGDRVKIKTFEKMKEECGIFAVPRSHFGFYGGMEEKLNKLNTNRVLTINFIKGNSFCSKEIGYWWKDDMIKNLAKDNKEPEEINSRFEILDIR